MTSPCRSIVRVRTGPNLCITVLYLTLPLFDQATLFFFCVFAFSIFFFFPFLLFYCFLLYYIILTSVCIGVGSLTLNGRLLYFVFLRFLFHFHLVTYRRGGFSSSPKQQHPCCDKTRTFPSNQSTNHDFPRRAVGFLPTLNPSRRAWTANVQLFPALLPPSRCPAHAPVGAVENSIGVRVPAGYLCLFDPFLVHGWDRCAFH